MHHSSNVAAADSGAAHAGLSTQDKELVARADERLARAYEQIALADVQLARVNEQISTLEKGGKRKKSRRSFRGRPALRGLLGLLVTAGVCAAAFTWHSHGETIRPIIVRWMPQLAPAPLQPTTLAADQARPAVQLAAAEAAVSQLPPAQELPPDAAEMLQTMTRDLATLRQEIDQIKAAQEALARDNAGNAEQIRESREQTARAIAIVSEQNSRRASAAPPLPVASPARRPVSAAAPTEARAQVRAPVRLQPRPQ